MIHRLFFCLCPAAPNLFLVHGPCPAPPAATVSSLRRQVPASESRPRLVKVAFIGFFGSAKAPELKPPFSSPVTKVACNMHSRHLHSHASVPAAQSPALDTCEMMHSNQAPLPCMLGFQTQCFCLMKKSWRNQSAEKHEPRCNLTFLLFACKWQSALSPAKREVSVACDMQFNCLMCSCTMSCAKRLPDHLMSAFPALVDCNSCSCSELFPSLYSQWCFSLRFCLILISSATVVQAPSAVLYSECCTVSAETESFCCI
jgi:hypothetical protein